MGVKFGLFLIDFTAVGRASARQLIGDNNRLIELIGGLKTALRGRFYVILKAFSKAPKLVLDRFIHLEKE